MSADDETDTQCDKDAENQEGVAVASPGGQRSLVEYLLEKRLERTLVRPLVHRSGTRLPRCRRLTGGAGRLGVDLEFGRTDRGGDRGTVGGHRGLQLPQCGGGPRIADGVAVRREDALLEVAQLVCRGR
ncbi:hypothetical protein E3O53_13145 [Cryobacterium sp. TMT2-18-3]|nr:hypothetical protein E3O22_05255 [Cryobacterium sp. TMT2-18-2]TFC61922.1 hypothetical protein E3O53_13145 [Cryobacterium sp. TMT2-18-3]